MYLINKLEFIKRSYGIDTIEYTLANYFINHLYCINELSLKSLSLDTNISKSSIIRFCKKAGYNGYTVFLNDLSIESQELKNQFNLCMNFDQLTYENMRTRFFQNVKIN